MNRDQQRFYAEYTVTLRSYLAGGGEAALNGAYELGRRAVAGGLGVLDLTEHHCNVMAALMQDLPPNSDLACWLSANSDFLKEVVSAYEITHLSFKEAADLLRHTLQFATNVCHELRSPLTSVMASAGMLQEIMAPGPDSQEGKLLENIIAGAGKLKARADNLDEIISLESGTVSLNVAPVDVRSLINGICQRFEPQLHREGINLEVSMPGELPYIMADRDRLEQVISNLVDNAIKYGSAGKVIRVKSGVKEGSLFIEVQDLGRGIPVWERPRLFQEHFRGDRTRQQVQGLGIGLALCKAIVGAHSGSIWVEGEEGRETVFKVSLPLRKLQSEGRGKREGAGD